MDLKEYKFAETHEWAREEDGLVIMGISDFAQEQLNDIVFIDLPETGQAVSKGEEILTVESTKTASAIHSPVSGTIEEVNTELESAPEMINESPFEEGWIVKISPDSPDELGSLLSYEDYKKLAEES